MASVRTLISRIFGKKEESKYTAIPRADQEIDPSSVSVSVLPSDDGAAGWMLVSPKKDDSSIRRIRSSTHSLSAHVIEGYASMEGRVTIAVRSEQGRRVARVVRDFKRNLSRYLINQYERSIDESASIPRFVDEDDRAIIADRYRIDTGLYEHLVKTAIGQFRPEDRAFCETVNRLFTDLESVELPTADRYRMSRIHDLFKARVFSQFVVPARDLDTHEMRSHLFLDEAYWALLVDRYGELRAADKLFSLFVRDRRLNKNELKHFVYPQFRRHSFNERFRLLLKAPSLFMFWPAESMDAEKDRALTTIQKEKFLHSVTPSDVRLEILELKRVKGIDSEATSIDSKLAYLSLDDIPEVDKRIYLDSFEEDKPFTLQEKMDILLDETKSAQLQKRMRETGVNFDRFTLFTENEYQAVYERLLKELPSLNERILARSLVIERLLSQSELLSTEEERKNFFNDAILPNQNALNQLFQSFLKVLIRLPEGYRRNMEHRSEFAQIRRLRDEIRAE